ncbi:MAG: hypothetical protein IJE68_04600 [Clostridia bacterium]|nr:hypothetical protein [Clostridia bacterium]
MNRLYLMKNPDLFQGEKILTTNKNYFEGWYFKNSNKEKGISFIPGINIDEENKKAFIQVITDDSSYFVNYPIEAFKFNSEPFNIKIGNSTFSKEGIHVDIEDEKQALKISGDVKYSNNKNINTSFMNPNIMGPFSYIPFMECNHAILSMKNNTNGAIKINNSIMNFEDDMGYIEKDWGCSFPKTYIWCQGNNFQNSNASFMLSIANVPFKMFNFRGMICILMLDDKEYKFTTYNNSKIVNYEVNDNFLNVTLKKGDYILNIKSDFDVNTAGQKLSAPVKGKMEKDIFETITAVITVTISRGDTVIFSDTSKNCGLEIVKE